MARTKQTARRTTGRIGDEPAWLRKSHPRLAGPPAAVPSASAHPVAPSAVDPAVATAHARAASAWPRLPASALVRAVSYVDFCGYDALCVALGKSDARIRVVKHSPVLDKYRTKNVLTAQRRLRFNPEGSKLEMWLLDSERPTTFEFKRYVRPASISTLSGTARRGPTSILAATKTTSGARTTERRFLPPTSAASPMDTVFTVR